MIKNKCFAIALFSLSFALSTVAGDLSNSELIILELAFKLGKLESKENLPNVFLLE